MNSIVNFLSHHFNKIANPLLIKPKQKSISKARTQKITNNLVKTAFNLGCESFYKKSSPKKNKNSDFIKFMKSKQSDLVYYNINKKHLHSAYDEDMYERCEFGM